MGYIQMNISNSLQLKVDLTNKSLINLEIFIYLGKLSHIFTSSNIQ